MVLFRDLGWDCWICSCMLKFDSVLINWFLVIILVIFFGVVGYVRWVKWCMFFFSFGKVFVVFWCFFFSIVWYNLVWLIGVNLVFNVLYKFLYV